MRSMAGRGDGDAGRYPVEDTHHDVASGPNASGIRVPRGETRAPTSALRAATSPAIAGEDDNVPRTQKHGFSVRLACWASQHARRIGGRPIGSHIAPPDLKTKWSK